jgi:hypothetical protein
MHSLTFSFAFVDLLVKLSFFRKLYSSTKQNILYYNMWNFMRMNARVPPPLTWPTFVRLLLIFLALLCLLIF